MSSSSSNGMQRNDRPAHDQHSQSQSQSQSRSDIAQQMCDVLEREKSSKGKGKIKSKSRSFGAFAAAGSSLSDSSDDDAEDAEDALMYYSLTSKAAGSHSQQINKALAAQARLRASLALRR